MLGLLHDNQICQKPKSIVMASKPLQNLMSLNPTKSKFETKFRRELYLIPLLEFHGKTVSYENNL